MPSPDDVSFQQRITDAARRIAPAERRVALYMRDHLQEVAFESAQTIGELAGTSDATVVRTAKALGYAGLPELRRAAGAALAQTVQPSAMLHYRLEHLKAGLAPIVAAVTNQAIEVLQETRRLITPESFAMSVDTLLEAREIMTYGIGPSGAVARYFALKLNRNSRAARAVVDTGFAMADALLPLQSDDVVVAFVPARLFRELEVLVGHASDVGARVILITDRLGPVFGSQLACWLPAPMIPGVSETWSSMLVADMLLLALAAHDEKSAVASSELLNRLRRALVEEV